MSDQERSITEAEYRAWAADRMRELEADYRAVLAQEFPGHDLRVEFTGFLSASAEDKPA